MPNGKTAFEQHRIANAAQKKNPWADDTSDVTDVGLDVKPEQTTIYTKIEDGETVVEKVVDTSPTPEENTEEVETDTTTEKATAPEAPQAEQEVAEQEQEQIEEGVADEEVEVNPAAIFAKELLKEGLINFVEDDEGGFSEENLDDLSPRELYNTFKRSAKEVARQEVKEEVKQVLEINGITDHHLTIARSVANGVHPDMLVEHNQHKANAEFKVKDASEEDKVKLLKRYYADRNQLSPDEADEIIEQLELKDRIDGKAEEAVEFYSGKYNSFKEEQEQIAKQREAQFEAQKKSNEDFLTSVLTRKEINGEKLSDSEVDAIRKGLTEPAVNYEYQGQQVPVTAFHDFLYKMQSDFQAQLDAFRVYHLQDKKLEILKEKAKKEADEEFLATLERKKIKSNRKSIAKKGDKSSKSDKPKKQNYWANL